MATQTDPANKEKYLLREKELREEQRKLRFNHALGQLDDTSKLRKNRKELARVLTTLSTINKMENKKA